MKYLLIHEVEAQDSEAFRKKNDERIIDSDKNPGKYPERVGAAYFVLSEWPKLSPDSIKGIEIVEAKDDEQIEDYVAFWFSAQSGIPSIRKWIMPLAQANRVAYKIPRNP